MPIELRLSSGIASIASDSAVTMLRAAAHDEPERHDSHLRDEASKGDTIATAALILAIPSAIVATMDLMERAKVVDRVREFLNKVREAEGAATLHGDADRVLDLKTAKADEVMDFLAMHQPF